MSISSHVTWAIVCTNKRETHDIGLFSIPSEVNAVVFESIVAVGKPIQMYDAIVRFQIARIGVVIDPIVGVNQP
jgi:hypothetical protein